MRSALLDPTLLAVEPRPPLEPSAANVLRGRDPFAAILHGIAATRVDDAATARSKARWLARQAEEEGTLAGVLVDLGERGEPVVVTTLAGRRFAGVVRALGVDFVALGARSGATVLVALPALASVRTRPGAAAVAGDRAVRVERRFAEVLAELAADRPAVVVGAGATEVRGELRAVGKDVATLRVDGTPATAAYLPLPVASDVVVG